MNSNEILETTNRADCGSPLFEGTAGERGCPNDGRITIDPATTSHALLLEHLVITIRRLEKD